MFIDRKALAFIAQTAKMLAGQTDPDLSLPVLLEQIIQHLGVEAVSIFLLDESTGELALRYAAGPVSRQVMGLRLPAGVGVVGWVAQFNDALLVPSPDLDPRFFSGVDRQTNFVTRSILCAPMARGDQKLGAIEALNKIGGAFTDDDVNLLQELARTVADTYAGVLPALARG